MLRRLQVLSLLAALTSCGGLPSPPARAATSALGAPHTRSKQDAAPAGPLHAESAADLHAALVAASMDIPPLLRLIDPEWGVGTYDTGDTGIAHHCAADEFTNHPGMAFTVHEDDRFSCDRSRRRCTSNPRSGGGFAFYFREGAGGAVYLDTIVHYDRAAPNRDSRTVMAFADGGEGVCAFRRALRPDAAAPRRFSVFVAHETGLVEDTVADHLCGDEAAAAYQERVTPYLSRIDSFECTRAPMRCSLRTGGEDIAILGDGPRGATAVTITRHGMYPNLERAQERDRLAFVRGLAGHSCEE
ncbi:MAG: hypothetical protein H6719_32385 [Sandaracinaceae bacterium]|nr:hypothetical protein [Sandaracinaceae bacterium]